MLHKNVQNIITNWGKIAAGIGQKRSSSSLKLWNVKEPFFFFVTVSHYLCPFPHLDTVCSLLSLFTLPSSFFFCPQLTPSFGSVCFLYLKLAISGEFLAIVVRAQGSKFLCWHSPCNLWTGYFHPSIAECCPADKSINWTCAHMVASTKQPLLT